MILWYVFFSLLGSGTQNHLKGAFRICIVYFLIHLVCKCKVSFFNHASKTKVKYREATTQKKGQRNYGHKLSTFERHLNNQQGISILDNSVNDNSKPFPLGI